jgi:hypothetical protein
LPLAVALVEEEDESITLIIDTPPIIIKAIRVEEGLP